MLSPLLVVLISSLAGIAAGMAIGIALGNVFCRKACKLNDLGEPSSTWVPDGNSSLNETAMFLRSASKEMRKYSPQYHRESKS